MRSAPLELAEAARTAIDTGGYPDVILCSDMLDLAQWRGILRDPRILQTPTAIYFHENQWTYPPSPRAQVDSHFGNLATIVSPRVGKRIPDEGSR